MKEFQKDDSVIIDGNRVKKLRLGANISQSELGDKIGMSKQGISRIEKSGEMVNVKEKTLNNLSTALECKPHYLLGLVDEVRGVLSEEDGEKRVLTSPIVKFDPVPRLTERVRSLGLANAELLNATLSVLECISIEEQRFLRAYLNSLTAYKKYTERRKSFPEYIIDSIYKENYMIKLYKAINDKTKVDKISFIRRHSSSEDDFILEMQKMYGDEIVQASHIALEGILADSFRKLYKQTRVRKGPLSRKIKQNNL